MYITRNVEVQIVCHENVFSAYQKKLPVVESAVETDRYYSKIISVQYAFGPVHMLLIVSQESYKRHYISSFFYELLKRYVTEINK